MPALFVYNQVFVLKRLHLKHEVAFQVVQDLCGKITLCFKKVRVILSCLFKYWRLQKPPHYQLYNQVYFDRLDCFGFHIKQTNFR